MAFFVFLHFREPGGTGYPNGFKLHYSTYKGLSTIKHHRTACRRYAGHITALPVVPVVTVFRGRMDRLRAIYRTASERRVVLRLPLLHFGRLIVVSADELGDFVKLRRLLIALQNMHYGKIFIEEYHRRIT